MREVYRRATTEPGNVGIGGRLVRGVIQAKIVAEPAGKRADCACCIRPHSPGVGEDHRRAGSLRAATRGVGRGVAEPEEEPQLVADRLVEANAHRVERAWVRPACKVISKTIAYGWPVGHWKCPDYRQERGRGCHSSAQAVRRRVNTSHAKVRHVIDRGRLGLDQAKPLIGNKKEAFILPVVQMGNSNRPAQRAAEIVLPERRLLYVLIAIKPIVRVEHIIAQILEGGAVPLVGS